MGGKSTSEDFFQSAGNVSHGEKSSLQPRTNTNGKRLVDIVQKNSDETTESGNFERIRQEINE